MAPVNKRRRSILKMSGSSAGAGGDLDFDVSNAENININASIVGPRKRVSFGRKRIKEISPIRKSSPVNKSHNSSVRVGNSTVLGSRDMDMDLSTIESSQQYNAASSAHRNHSVRVGNSTVIGARDMDLTKEISPIRKSSTVNRSHNSSVRVGNSTVLGSRDMDMDLSTIEPSQHYNDNAASSAHRNRSVRVGNSTVMGSRDMMDMDLSTIEPSQHYNDNAESSAHRDNSVRVGNSTVIGARDMDLTGAQDPFKHYAAAAPSSFSYGLSVPAPIIAMNRKTLCNPFQKRTAKIAGMVYSVKTPKRAAFRCFQPAVVQRLPVNQSVVVPEKKRLNDLHLSSELFEYVSGGWKKMDFDARFQKKQTFYQELAKMNEATYQKFQTTYGDCFTIYYFKEVDNYRKEFRELGHCNPLILHL